MNGYEKHGLDDDAFGPSSNLATGLRTFDAFPKTKKSYTQASSRGGQWTVALALFCFLLATNELKSWWTGTETHHFSVERGIGHELQLNLDIVVHMPCRDLHVNVQDAAMDRIVAGDLLSKDDTNWDMWLKRPPSSRDRPSKNKAYNTLNEANDLKRRRAEEEDAHVGHVLGHMREGGRKFSKTPKLRRNEVQDACRIYGSLEGNKVQGDFHITARGHGYMEFGPGSAHLDHSTFNFSHHINELSFGPHFPNLLNPLDHTSDTTPLHFYKFQYYLSIVPTIYTKRRVATNNGILDPRAIPLPPTLDMQPDIPGSKPNHAGDKKQHPVKHIANPNRGHDRKSVFTNQYAATSQSHVIAESSVPGIFFKYDIEPILLIVSETRNGFLRLVVRLVNVISGVVVGGGWLFLLSEWVRETWKRRRGGRGSGGGGGAGGGGSYGVLHGRSDSKGF